MGLLTPEVLPSQITTPEECVGREPGAGVGWGGVGMSTGGDAAQI